MGRGARAQYERARRLRLTAVFLLCYKCRHYTTRNRKRTNFWFFLNFLFFSGGKKEKDDDDAGAAAVMVDELPGRRSMMLEGETCARVVVVAVFVVCELEIDQQPRQSQPEIST